jgi:hypothetical protein|tara:strand:+ start:426 stop:629 length:204 start_codon:yes stop_codon:yes gene_type:complete
MKGWHGGKGSGRRRENQQNIDHNWDFIFGKKDINSTLDDDSGVLKDGSSEESSEEEAEEETRGKEST